MNNETIGLFLRQARMDAGKSQQDVASHLGYGTAQFLSNIERGISRPPLSSIKKLSRFVKADPVKMINLIEDFETIRLRAKFEKYRKAVK